MLIEQIKHCAKCNKNTIHKGEKHKFNWFLHFVLTLLTGLLWLVPFLFYYMAKKDTSSNMICSEC